jgi:hypothetical protein
VNENPDLCNNSTAFQTFDSIFKNLKRECREVDMDEDYTYGGYIENMFWKFVLTGTYYFCNNRS